MPKLRLASAGPACFAIVRSVRRDRSWRSPRSVDGFGQVSIAATCLDLVLLGLDIEAVEARGIKSENLGFRFHRQHRTGLLGDIGRNLERHELVDQPFRRPDPVVAPIENLVRSNPEQELGNDMSKIPRTRMDEWQRHGKTGIDVGFLGRDPAEIVQTWQAAMLNNE